MPKRETKKAPRQRGPEPDRLKLKDDWKAAVKKSLAKKKPATGWPKD